MSACHYYAAGITPAMAYSKPGTGSAYAYATRDSLGRYLDGGKTYKTTLPAPIPAGQFWSFMVYDGQTRSILGTDQKLAGLDSSQKGIEKNPDGSVTVWFAPETTSNWRSDVCVRLSGPLAGFRLAGPGAHRRRERPAAEAALATGPAA